MKKIAFLFAALAALAVSCQKASVTDEVPARGIEKTFLVSAPETRTTLDGLSVKWAAGDEINVIAATTGNQYTFTLSEGEGTTSGTFTGTLDADDAEETTFYAVYPNIAIRKASLANDILEADASLGAVQTAVKGGFDPHFALMTAVSGADGQFTFRHGAAYFKIAIGNEDVVSVNLKTSNTRFQGRPQIVASTGAYSNIQGAQDNIALSAAEGSTLERGATYYIPVLCKNSNLKVLTLTYNFSDGTSKSKSTEAKSSVKLELGKVYDLGTPTFSLAPEIAADGIVLEADATSGSIAYTVTNPVEGQSVTATLEEGVDWISNLVVGDAAVTFDCTANTGTEARTATVTLRYEGAESVAVTVRQKEPNAAPESHEYVFYLNSSGEIVQLMDGEACDYFTVSGSNKLQCSASGYFGVDSYTVDGLTLNYAKKIDGSNNVAFTTRTGYDSTVRFYCAGRNIGESGAKMNLVDGAGNKVVALDLPWADDSAVLVDSGLTALTAGTTYNFSKSKEVGLFYVIVTENEIQ